MKIAIVGLGLIGGSLGLAIKARNPEVCIIGYDNQALISEQALAKKVIDKRASELVEIAKEADIIVLCTPVLQIESTVKQLVPHLKEGTILTDVGSTKKYLVNSLSLILPTGVHYVAGHPMAGSEQSGIAAADKDLFHNKWYILIKTSLCSDDAFSKIHDIIGWTGANITVMDVDKHDEYAAVISHVPHVAAAALVNLLAEHQDLNYVKKLIGGGFKDTTRIASSNADMWADICITNPHAIGLSLVKLRSQLDHMITAISQGDRQTIYKFFAEAKERRDVIISE